MKLKKTDYIVISILIVVVIAGIIGIVLAVNLMGENTRKEREERSTIESNNSIENQTINGIDVNASAEEQMQQLVNSIPTALQGSNSEKAIKNIRIKYAYGYDIAMAEENKFIDILEFECIDDDLTSLRELIEKNKLDVNESNIPTGTDTYYNTQVIMDNTKILSFSDKNASYQHDNRTSYVVLNDDLLKKLGEIVNREASKNIVGIKTDDIKSVSITNSNNATVTITDAEDIKTIGTLSNCVKLNSNVDLSKEKILYIVDFKNGVEMQVTSGGATGYIVDNNGKTQVKFMFNAETGLEYVFKKYSN